MIEYEMLNQILDTVIKVLDEIKDKYQLSNARVERWRWDYPQITMTWQGSDDIQRNIVTLIADSTTDPDNPSGHTEINAWRDEREGENWIRYWKHKQTDEGRILPHQWCQKAYEIVTSWDDQSLDRKHVLSKGAGAIIEA